MSIIISIEEQDQLAESADQHEEPATERGDADLETGRPKVDDQAEVLSRGHQPAAPSDCWESIMSAIIIRMNSSASSVIPPDTPP